MPLDVNALARLGAQARLAELEQELNDLHAAFPELRGAAQRLGRAPSTAAVSDVESDTEAKPGRRASAWSAAQRAAVGRRMKKYWAEKRKATTASVAAAPAVKAVASRTRTMSPEARARISAAQKKRWAAHRSAKKA